MISKVLLQAISDALGGHEHGEGYSMFCPLCNSEKPSLSIWITPEQKLGIKCHYAVGSSCPPMALVFHLQTLGVDVSLSDLSSAKTTPSKTWPEIWNAGEPIKNTHTHDYLYSRGIDIFDIPALRNLQYFKHPTGSRYPCMLAHITDPITDVGIGLHRTYLNHMGSGKADVVPNKMTLGSIDKGIIRLHEPKNGVIAIGEGIETCLSFTILYGTPSWSTVTAGNLSRISFPSTVKTVIILKDNDAAGDRATEAAKMAIRDMGLLVHVVSPPPVFKDYNDQLRGEVTK